MSIQIRPVSQKNILDSIYIVISSEVGIFCYNEVRKFSTVENFLMMRYNKVLAISFAN